MLSPCIHPAFELTFIFFSCIIHCNQVSFYYNRYDIISFPDFQIEHKKERYHVH